MTPLVAFLEELGAGRVRHSGRTLLEHLVGTAAILERWGASERVRRAGLFHSVYGTAHFEPSLVSIRARARMKRRLGVEAERLVHLFCAAERASLFGALAPGAPRRLTARRGHRRFDVSARDLADLATLHFANALEQSTRVERSPAAQASARRTLAASASVLPARALLELEPVYGSVRARDLATLLHVDAGTFLRSYWPERLFLANGPAARFAGLEGLDLGALVATRRVRTTAFRVEGDRPVSIRVEPGQERALYDAGFTIYFHSLKSPVVDPWIEALDAELGLVRGATRVSAFASRRGGGLKAHYDTNYNFVCQVRGAKRWRVAVPQHVRYPTVGYTVGEPASAATRAEIAGALPSALPEPYHTFELRPGSVMFLPAGVWHDTETVEEESIHLNVQCGLATWKDVLEYVLCEMPTMSAVEELRAPIPRLADGEAVLGGEGVELEAKIRALLGAVAGSKVAIPYDGFRRFLARRRSAS